MTRNQIDYAKLLETRRANQRQEELTGRRDAETQRHNRESEAQQYVMLGETERHNRAGEVHAQASLQESKRHSLAIEGETVRHNQASEIEARRQRETTERLRERELGIRSSELQESKRSHMAVEQLRGSELEETHRHNVVGEVRQAAVDTFNQIAKQQEIALGRDQLAQKIAHETAMDAETVRHNIVSESKYAPPTIQVTTGPTNVQTGDTKVNVDNERTGINAEETQEVPSEEAKQGGTVFQSDGKFFRKNGDGTYYIWEDATPFSIVSTYRWRKVRPSEIGRYDLQDW